MRKDVKFGLAVGGILLAVLVAYVLFVPPTDTTTVSLNPGDAAPDVRDLNSNPTDSVVGDVRPGPATVPAPATRPTVTMTPGPTDVWGSLLAQGPAATPDPFRDTRAAIPPAGDARTGGESSLIPPATRPAPTGEREHKVQRGETLTSISTAAYGKPDYWPLIAKANPTVDAKHLKIGTVLVLPKIEPEAPRVLTPTVTPFVAPVAADPRTTVAPVAAGNTHTVKKGDTLYTISAEHFGTAMKWDKIYDLNKAAIGADPAKLKIGMVLKLPEAAAAPAAPAGGR